MADRENGKHSIFIPSATGHRADSRLPHRYPPGGLNSNGRLELPPEANQSIKDSGTPNLCKVLHIEKKLDLG
jgi:hypothetical protein